MPQTYRFGPFRLDREAGILFCGADPTMLGQRAVALLSALLNEAGRPVSKNALIEAAWPGLAVEDSNLTVQIAALRRVIEQAVNDETWIETLPRRGYRYVGPPVTTDGGADAPAAEASKTLALPDRPSIAVLPFSNLSGEPDHDYFADGMVDDIIVGLSRIKWLFVIARNSTFAYKGQAVDLKRVRRELGVQYVLEGSVRRQGERVRVAAQLIDTANVVHVWADRYDRATGDVFALQDEIALAVVAAIEPNLRRAEVERVKRKRSDSLDAYDLVLQAQSDVYSGMPERSTKALVLLDRALALDPSYALAHGFAAMAHHNRFLRSGLQEKDKALSIRHARAAIAHGRDDALALTFAGFSIAMDGHERAAAFAAFDTALAVSPSSALTYILGSVVLGWAGEAERAIDWAERGMRLSPLDAWAFAAYHAIMLGHFHRGRHEQAMQAAYRAVQYNPDHSISYMLLAAALIKNGRPEQARSAAARVLELQPGFQCHRHFYGVDCAEALAAALSEALLAAGLPQ
jgi:TolB-like protein/Tfp pilus assembly protein PilF